MTDIRMSGTTIFRAALLVHLFLAFSNAGSLVVCFGEDGHISLEASLAVPIAPERHGLPRPCHPADEVGSPSPEECGCGACLDIPLPAPTGSSLLQPARGRIPLQPTALPAALPADPSTAHPAPPGPFVEGPVPWDRVGRAHRSTVLLI
jgi:hypothetical protein